MTQARKLKELCRDVVGKRARLLHDITTRGGTTFKAGTILDVCSTHQGKFHLRTLDHDPSSSDTGGIRRVRRLSFQIVDGDA